MLKDKLNDHHRCKQCKLVFERWTVAANTKWSQGPINSLWIRNGLGRVALRLFLRIRLLETHFIWCQYMGAWMGVVIYRDIHKFAQRCSRRWEVLCHWGNSAPLLGTLHFVEKALYKTYPIGTSKLMVTKVKWNFSVAWQRFFLFIFSKWLIIPFNIMFISLLYSIVKPLAFHPFSLSVIDYFLPYR